MQATTMDQAGSTVSTGNEPKLSALLRNAVAALLGVGALPARNGAGPCGYVGLTHLVDMYRHMAMPEATRDTVARYLETLLAYLPGQGSFLPSPDAVHRHERTMSALVLPGRS